MFGMCMHFTCKYHDSDLIHKWKCIKWNSVHTWKQPCCMADLQRHATQSYRMHWEIVPCCVEKLNCGYRYSNVK
jgi:hypothetical protein